MHDARPQILLDDRALSAALDDPALSRGLVPSRDLLRQTAVELFGVTDVPLGPAGAGRKALPKQVLDLR